MTASELKAKVEDSGRESHFHAETFERVFVAE